MVQKTKFNDIPSYLSNSVLLKDSFLRQGSLVKNPNPKSSIEYFTKTGKENYVYKFDINGQYYACRCWKEFPYPKDIHLYYQHLSNHFSSKSLYLVNFKYNENGFTYGGSPTPLMWMDWVNGMQLDEYLAEKVKINDNGECLKALAAKFKKMVEYLHRNSIAHGDLHHGNILVEKNGDLKLVDYDSIYVKGLERQPDRHQDSPGYQHPNRKDNRFLNEKLDYFSEMVIYISILALSENPALWTAHRKPNSEHLLISRADIDDPDSSAIFQEFDKYSYSQEVRSLAKKIKDALRKHDILLLEPWTGKSPKRIPNPTRKGHTPTTNKRNAINEFDDFINQNTAKPRVKKTGKTKSSNESFSFGEKEDRADSKQKKNGISRERRSANKGDDKPIYEADDKPIPIPSRNWYPIAALILLPVLFAGYYLLSFPTAERGGEAAVTINPVPKIVSPVPISTTQLKTTIEKGLAQVLKGDRSIEKHFSPNAIVDVYYPGGQDISPSESNIGYDGYLSKVKMLKLENITVKDVHVNSQNQLVKLEVIHK